jgi:hypothetical protein
MKAYNKMKEMIEKQNPSANKKPSLELIAAADTTGATVDNMQVSGWVE